MSASGPHDRGLLDGLAAMKPVRFSGVVWRVTRAGDDPRRGSAAAGRWSPGGNVEVIWASLARAGAMAELGIRFWLEPVWPGGLVCAMHELAVRRGRCLSVPSMGRLAALGVDVDRYDGFDYGATQALAAAAHFLEFDGMIVPGARHESKNLVLFMDRCRWSIKVQSSVLVD